MTTIAYSVKHRMLAADRQITSENIIIGEMTKIIKVGGILASVCGNSAIAHTFLDWVKSGCPGNPPELMADAREGKIDACGIIFMGDLAVEFIHCGVQIARNSFFAYGSGGDIARGALALGHSPEEAIHAAAQNDCYTGRGVDVLRF